MDLDEFRSFILDSGVDVWTWIDMAISVASADHENEMKNRRDGIVQKLYAPAFLKCENCDHRETIKKSERNGIYLQKQGLGFDCNTEEMGLGKRVTSNEDDDDDDEDDDDEQRRILEIKILLDDQNQSEKGLVELLQRLVDMDTTFKTLKETEIGRNVTKLRKHSSNEVRKLVKILIRKWKDTVDEWVRSNPPMEEEANQFNGDRKTPNEGRHVSIHNGVKAATCCSTPEKRKVKHKSDEFVSDGKHIHDHDYQETQHAKKRRTGQVMEFHDIPKPKNSMVSSNGGSVPIKYW